jgi:hypothetical protein
MRLLRDLAPLIALQLLLLAVTLVIGPSDGADVRVQLVWSLALLPGWLLAPNWAGQSTSFLRRYLAATITSLTIHCWLVIAGNAFGFGMLGYRWCWLSLIAVAMATRHFQLREPTRGLRLPRRHALVILTLVIFSVAVYRVPRSNDIQQFMLQQQDMLAAESLQVSSIGMSAMEVDAAMPRWRAHLWHLVPCLLADNSGVAVDLVLLRYGTIPVAMTFLLSLAAVIHRLLRRCGTISLVGLAMLGPVLLWYRNYNAFNYSFRITNNFLLDKDLALFLLIPAIAFLADGWLRGRTRFGWMMLAMIPAILRVHPLTAVYLLLLTPPLLLLSMPRARGGVKRAAVLMVGALAMFAAVIALEDARSNHEQIQEVIRLDYQRSLDNRPLHYWVGFYNTIPNTGLSFDTTRWSDGRLWLKPSLLLGDGLLLMFQVCLAGLLLLCCFGKTPRGQRLLASGSLTLLMLWGMQLFSGAFLTRFPHYAAGLERLHWFAYPIALCVTAFTFDVVLRMIRLRRVAGTLTLIWVVVASVLYRADLDSPLVHTRGLHGLLDHERPSHQKRRRDLAAIDSNRNLQALRPSYLRPSDRVLLLDLASTEHYWLIRQGSFWSDPYVEGFALYHRGDAFLRDREVFYRLLNRRHVERLADWIARKGITVWIDFQPDASEFLRQLEQQHDIEFERVAPEAWRVR